MSIKRWIKFGKSELFTADLEASQFVVDLEYAVLTLYSNHKKIKEAWERYYRMIYKDSYSRILPTSKKILNTFQNEASQNNKKLTTIEYAQILLSWVQNFEYRRANSKLDSDFTSKYSCREIIFNSKYKIAIIKA